MCTGTSSVVIAMCVQTDPGSSDSRKNICTKYLLFKFTKYNSHLKLFSLTHCWHSVKIK